MLSPVTSSQTKEVTALIGSEALKREAPVFIESESDLGLSHAQKTDPFTAHPVTTC